MTGILGHFTETGALLRGHFRLSSGLHSDTYLQCALVLADTRRAVTVCGELAALFTGGAVDAVVGPALGGVVLAWELARQLGTRGLFVEREGASFTLRRGFTLAPGSRVIVAEDVVTTGGSARETVDLCRSLGARVVAVMALVQRAERNPFDVPFIPLTRIRAATWSPDQCPLCREGSTPVKPGSRPETAAAGTAP